MKLLFKSGKRKTVSNEEKLILLDNFLKVVDRFGKSGFDDFVGLGQSVKELSTSHGLVYEMKVPKRLCDEENILPIGIVITMFDTISTHALIIEDLTHRPGVSISLEADYFSLIKSGDDIIVSTKVIKIGKAVGFASCTIQEKSSGKTLVKGLHVKYMPMGLIWNFCFGYFPKLSVALANVLAQKMRSKNITTNNELTLQDIIKLTDWAENNRTANFYANKHHHNPMGGLHGGCQAVLCEHVARQANTMGNGKRPRILSINISYFSVGRGQLEINAEENEGKLHAASTIIVNVLKNKSGISAPISQARLICA